MTRCRQYVCLGVIWTTSLWAATIMGYADDGFRPLFDGQTLSGWRGYQQTSPPNNWSVDDGQIKGDGQGPDLITQQKFGDFELRFEWKLAKDGNSGILYRVDEAGENSQHSGPEYEVLDVSDEDSEVAVIHSAGAVYGLYALEKTPVHAAGEYNTGRIIARGTHLEHWLNGQRVAECEIGSADWKQKVAASRFQAWPSFAATPSGHIALQSHGSDVWYRNVRIKLLPPPPEATQ